MPAGLRDLTIEQGADWTYALRWTRGGSLVDLTDWTTAMQVREDPCAPTVLLELTEGNGRITHGTTGILHLTLTGLQTAAILPARYRPLAAVGGRQATPLGVYDVKLTHTGGEIVRLLAGRMFLSLAVTR